MRYISLRNPEAAAQLKGDVLSGISFIGENPLSGRERPELTNKPFRFWVVRKNYLLIYTFDSDLVKIHAVLHVARDLPWLLG